MIEITNEEYKKQIEEYEEKLASLKRQFDELAKTIPQKPKKIKRSRCDETYLAEKLFANNSYKVRYFWGSEYISSVIRRMVWQETERTIPVISTKEYTNSTRKKVTSKTVFISVDDMTDDQYKIYIDCFNQIIDALVDAIGRKERLEKGDLHEENPDAV